MMMTPPTRLSSALLLFVLKYIIITCTTGPTTSVNAIFLQSPFDINNDEPKDRYPVDGFVVRVRHVDMTGEVPCALQTNEDSAWVEYEEQGTTNLEYGPPKTTGYAKHEILEVFHQNWTDVEESIDNSLFAAGDFISIISLTDTYTAKIRNVTLGGDDADQDGFLAFLRPYRFCENAAEAAIYENNDDPADLLKRNPFSILLVYNFNRDWTDVPEEDREYLRSLQPGEDVAEEQSDIMNSDSAPSNTSVDNDTSVDMMGNDEEAPPGSVEDVANFISSASPTVYISNSLLLLGSGMLLI